MELHQIYSLPTAACCIISLVILLHILYRNREKARAYNPPQPRGAWPVIGHLHLLGRSELPHKVFGKMADTCGPIFTIKLGVHKALVVSDAEIAKECFTTNDKAFASRPKSLAVEHLSYNYAMFGLGPYGEYWKQVRKMVTVQILSQRRVEMLAHIRVPEVRASMKEIYQAWDRSKETIDSDMLPMEMDQIFRNLVLNIVTRTISGKRFSPDDEKAVRVQVVVRKFFELLGTFLVSDFIPYVKCLDLGGHKKAMKLSAKEMDDILQGWLDEHKKRRDSTKQYEGTQDFMDVLISVLEGASKEEYPGFDHDTIIKATSLVILTGSLDTTPVTLTWALSLLLNNPEAMKTVQDELDVHVGRERLVEESDIKNLVYLQAIIKETLRLYPAAPISVAHESTEDCTVATYNIPKGTRLIVNVWKLHRDPEVWSDPNQFKPERFLTSQKDIDLKGQHHEYIPFGSGRRMCPGVSYALQSLHIMLATLLQGFEIAKPSKEPIDMSESFGLTNMKATPLDVLLSPRLSNKLYQADASKINY